MLLSRVQARRKAAQSPAAAATSGAPAASKPPDLGFGGSLIVASLAGCINVLATTPIWIVATQMQASASQGISS